MRRNREAAAEDNTNKLARSRLSNSQWTNRKDKSSPAPLLQLKMRGVATDCPVGVSLPLQGQEAAHRTLGRMGGDTQRALTLAADSSHRMGTEEH